VRVHGVADVRPRLGIDQAIDLDQGLGKHLAVRLANQASHFVASRPLRRPEGRCC
jgi:hypothetical protein